MSYLRFDKNLMINLDQSLPKEILRTNQSGAYHCTTIVGCNTRKQHGLLVIPIPELDDENHVLLSSLDETVIQHGAPFNLGIHRYKGNVYSPNGHKYIREYDCEKLPTTTYRVGGVILKKEKVFVTGENRILRGGCFNSPTWACSVYERSWYLPDYGYSFFGFRLALDSAEREDQ